MKKIVLDMLLNIGSTAIPTLILQLCVLPMVAQSVASETYGLLVTVVAFITVISSASGSMLNNIRLLYDGEYKQKHIEGDFNVLVTFFSILNFVSILVFSVVYDTGLSIFSLLLTVLISLTWFLKEYFIVAFRIQINYPAVLASNLLKTLGYILGYIAFLFTGSWQLIYLSGNVLSLAYILVKSKLWREAFKITPLFSKVSKQGAMLMLANILSYILTYADKLIIFPILGGAQVAVYYAASSIGKVVSMTITPINSVVLTYLTKLNKKADRLFVYALLAGITVCILGYFVCAFICHPVLNFIYPQYVEEAMNYVWITTGTTVTYALISIMNPFILRFFDMKWQIVINAFTVVMYITLCLCFMHMWDLLGFCIGALLTNILKALVMPIIYFHCRVRVENN